MKNLLIAFFLFLGITAHSQVSVYTSPRIPKDSLSKAYVAFSKKNGNVVSVYSMRADSLLMLADSLVFSDTDFSGLGTTGSPLSVKDKVSLVKHSADSAALRAAMSVIAHDTAAANSVYFSNAFSGTGTQLSPISITGITNTNLSGSAGITGANLSSTIALPSGTTVTTQSPGNYSTSPASTAYTDDAASEDFIQTLQSIGSNIKAITVGAPFSSFVTGLQLSDGILYSVPVYFKKPETLTGVRLVMHTQGAFTGDNENRIGLYSESGGTLTLIASSTNNLTLWTAAANSLVTVPFSSTVNVNKGKYYVGIMYNNSAETTAPKVIASTDYNSAVWTAITTTATNSNRLYGSKAAATLPATITASTLAQPSSNIPLVMPY